MEKKMRVGIIGCGGIAGGKHLPAIREQGNIEVVALCDLIEERALNYREKFGWPDATVYTDYKELLKEELDAVYVLTPNKAHSQITIDALHAGKNVMCEKPMAKTAADAKAMLDAAKETGRVLTIGYQNRYRPDSTYLKRACDILLKVLPAERICGTVENIGREGESSKLYTLGELRDAQVNMFTTVFIGNSMTKEIGGRMVTPRGYRI